MPKNSIEDMIIFQIGEISYHEPKVTKKELVKFLIREYPNVSEKRIKEIVKVATYKPRLRKVI